MIEGLLDKFFSVKVVGKESTPEVIDFNRPTKVSMTYGNTWYVRLWRMVTNPFLYVIIGKKRW